MATAREWLDFYYPHLSDGANTSYANDDEIAMAMAVAQDFRPVCLTEDRQNQAQAHYTAYVLEFRQKVKSAGLSVSSAMTQIVSGPIVEKQEGSTRIKYSEKAIGATTTAQIQTNMTGPGTAYAAWFALWGICLGADPVTGSLTVRRGGLITRFGLLDG